MATWLVVWTVAVVINLVPAFMPPTWSLLAYVHVREGLPIWPLAAVGAAGAVVGRAGLALTSRAVGRRFVPRRQQASIDALSETLARHKGVSRPLLVLFGLGPVPTNDLFIAAGLTRAPLPPLLAVFGLTRFLSYAVWVSATGSAATSLRDVLSPRLGGGIAIAAEVLGVIGLILLVRLDWARVLRRWLPKDIRRRPPTR